MNVSKSSNKMASHQVPRFLPYFGITRIQCLSCRCTSFVICQQQLQVKCFLDL